MIHDRKKLAKIIDELMMYFFSIGGTQMSSTIILKGKEATLTFESDYKHEYGHKLETMEKLLNSDRDDGIEDVYWELAGSGDPGESSQLLLVGMMLDKAKVDIDGDWVRITMQKRLA